MNEIHHCVEWFGLVDPCVCTALLYRGVFHQGVSCLILYHIYTSRLVDSQFKVTSIRTVENSSDVMVECGYFLITRTFCNVYVLMYKSQFKFIYHCLMTPKEEGIGFNT